MGIMNKPTLMAVCRSERRSDPKTDVGKGELRVGWGLVGDSHAGPARPGRWEISLLAWENVEQLNREHGLGAVPGSFAENLTTRGLDTSCLRVGERLRIGAQVVLEVQQLGKPPEIAHTYSFRGHSLLPSVGVFCRVLAGGVVRKGDSIQVKASETREGRPSMSVLDQLSSGVDDRTEGSNRAVAEQCLSDASLLPQIADGLRSGDRMLAGDCAEVLTMVAEANPALVSPFAGALCTLLDHEYTRARWEAVHALALVAKSVPETVHSNLPTLAGMIRTDKSTIVRDYSVDAVANYASTGPPQAEESYLVLMEVLALWEGKHAHHALPGLAHVARSHPEHREDIRRVAEDKLDHPKGVVQKAARDLLRSLK
jgi:MOSC domain-containing protein YiiM